MSDEHPSYATLDHGAGRPTLHFERHLPHGPETVWRALIDEQALAAWFPTTIDGDRAEGAALTFRFEHVELEPMGGEMLAFEPPSLLEFTWGGDLLRFEHVELEPMGGEMLAFEPPSLLEFTWGGDLLRFELAPDGEGTKLTFTVELDELGKATRDGAGWHQCLDSLSLSLAADPRRPEDPDRWRGLRDVYADRFGPEASTLGPPQEWEDAHTC
jgi:uncharacterized protein YndB with AHSA1/START domain